MSSIEENVVFLNCPICGIIPDIWILQDENKIAVIDLNSDDYKLHNYVKSHLYVDSMVFSELYSYMENIQEKIYSIVCYHCKMTFTKADLIFNQILNMVRYYYIQEGVEHE